MKIIILAPLTAVLASYPRPQDQSYGYFTYLPTIEVVQAPLKSGYQIPNLRKITNAPTPNRWSRYSYRDLVIDELPPTPSLEDFDLKDPNHDSDEAQWQHATESDENSGEDSEDLMPSLEESDENNP